jgi:oxygen-dependent protoporphyrinogen oxidase
MTERVGVCIVGAGISGLTAAFWLREAGVEVVVLEKEMWPGGTMRTAREGGWLIETGPNSALETTPLIGAMTGRIGLPREYADPSSNRRYILRDGELHAIPMSPGAFLRTRLWSTRGKLRLLKEPFIGRASQEESIAQFVERRLGREFLDYAINPFVAGVYAGNPEGLSVRSAFPKLYALEEKYGGLIRGMIGGARERKKRAETAKDRARMFSFRDGMQSLPDALGAYLEGGIRYGVSVRSVRPLGDGARGFSVAWETAGGESRLEAEAVVLAVPAFAAAPMVAGWSADLPRALEEIAYPPVVEVFMGFRSEQVGRPLDGFGYLIPAREKRAILGTIWSSALFPGRAPDGHAAFTTFVGGSRQPQLAGRPDGEMREMVLSELRAIMRITGEPVLTRIVRWPRAIPQYRLGYHSTVERIERAEAAYPGFYVCANYRGGIAVGDCVINGEKTARRIVEARAAGSA